MSTITLYSETRPHIVHSELNHSDDPYTVYVYWYLTDENGNYLTDESGNKLISNGTVIGYPTVLHVEIEANIVHSEVTL